MTINPSESREDWPHFGYYRYRGGLDLHFPLRQHALNTDNSGTNFPLDNLMNVIYSYLTKFERQNMHIHFDTVSTNEVETRALIALLSALLPSVNGHVQPSVPSTLNEQLKVSLALADTQTPGPVLVEPAAAVEPAKRTRRTREQIAADEAQQRAVVALASGVPVTEVSATAQHVNGSLKVISADELRALLNGYIARHSMEEAIDKLKSFGCNRVTEALALESAKLNELAATLNG